MATATKLLAATYDITRVMAALERGDNVSAAANSSDVQFDKTSNSSRVETPVVERPIQSIDTTIKSDTELGRLAVGLRFALVFRLWLAMVEVCRLAKRNWVTRAEIETALTRYRVKYSQRNLSRWIHQGVGVFWNVDTATGRLYPVGYANLSIRLVEKAYQHGLHALYETNTPGQRRSMYIEMASDRVADFEANVYAAWIASRENLIISRVLMALLWNRTVPVLRSWEAAADIKVTPNYSFTDEQFFDAIPRQANGEWRRDVHRTTHNGREVIAWQIPNSYAAKRIRQHDKKGQHRRVAILLKKLMDMLQALTICEESGHAPDERLNRNTRRYFQQHKGAKDSANLHGNRERYVFKSRWNRYGFFEYTPDGGERLEFWQCRRLFRREQIVCFAKRVKVLAGREYTHPF